MKAVNRWSPGVLAAVILAGVALSCNSSVGGSGGDTPTEPGFLLGLEAEPAAMGIWDVSLLTATATDLQGNPVVGAAVHFSTSLGYLDEAVVVTDAEGQALNQLRGEGRAGTARVTVVLQGQPVTAELSLPVGQGVQIQASANPQTIALGGTSLITLVALNNDTGSSVPGGTVIHMATTLGDFTNYDPRTDSLGVATTTLLAGQEEGVAHITATISGVDTVGRVSVAVGEGIRISVRADPEEIPIEGESVLRVRVRDRNGSPLGPGTEVVVVTTLGRVIPQSIRTGLDGYALTTLRGTGTAGVATVVASVGLVSSDPIEVGIGLGG